MNKSIFSRQENRLKWIWLWEHILEDENWNFGFFQVPEIRKWVWETELITDVHINFHGDFFKNGKYMWPSSLDNARLVVEEAKNYTNLYDLFFSEPFDSNLNLHKSTSSLCEQNENLIEENIGEDVIFHSDFYYTNQTSEEYFKSLDVSTWSYEVVIISAICYLVENIYVEYDNKVKDFYNPNKTSIFYKNPNYLELIKQGISFKLDMLIRKIGVYLLDKQYSKQLFSVLNNTNIFRIESFATLKGFTAIFKELPKRQYSYYLENNTNIVETSSRFFQVFQLNFIFSDSLIVNEIQQSINNDTNSISYSGGLVEILNIYKLFLQNYFRFRNDSKKLLSFNNPKLETSNQQLFVTTFFHNYISDIPYLEINGAIEVFKKLFPSIQFDILQHLEQRKKNQKLKEKLNQVKNTIGLIGPIFHVQNSFSENSFKPPSPSVTYATSISNQAVSSKEGIVKRPPEDIPASLRRRNYKAEAAQFQKYQQQKRDQHETVFQQSQLSKRYIIVPKNSDKLKGKDVKGLVLIEEQETGILTPMGNIGSYDALDAQQTALNNSKIKHDNAILRKAHFCYEKLRKACGVSRGDGLCWLVPSCINQVEEHKPNQKNRDYTYEPNIFGISLTELIFDKTAKSWEYIIQTVASDCLLESDKLDFLHKSFETNVNTAIKELDQRRIHLKIPENKSLFYLYSGDVLQKIGQLTDTIKPYALHTAGNGRTLRVPGEVLSEACDKVYVLTRIGKTYIEELGSPIAKEVFSNLLKGKITDFCNEFNNVAIANISYRENGRQNIPQLIIFFNEIPVFGVSNPDIPTILKVGNQLSNVIQLQDLGDLQDALDTGVNSFNIGDFRNGTKPRIIQTTNRKASENFKHIELTQPIDDASTDSRWVC